MQIPIKFFLIVLICKQNLFTSPHSNPADTHTIVTSAPENPVTESSTTNSLLKGLTAFVCRTGIETLEVHDELKKHNPGVLHLYILQHCLD
jgi:hypothetical protein